jgi:hypothetical protein
LAGRKDEWAKWVETDRVEAIPGQSGYPIHASIIWWICGKPRDVMEQENEKAL